ncbi:MAG: glycerate kinase [Nitrospinaceae bacterium]|nr:glycerate kinase [Nitrospinaceae bacterium]
MATRRSAPALRVDAKAIFRAGLDSVRAKKAIPAFVDIEKMRGATGPATSPGTRRGERLKIGKRRFKLPANGRLIVTGAGKASAHMARALERILGRRIDGGILVTQKGHAVPCQRVEIIEASHPVPDAAGIKAAKRIGKLLDDAGKDDLVICLLSGGGSALLPAPAQGITLKDKRQTTEALLKAGAPIEALNCVRKHLSRLKGGQFAQRAHPARLVTLAISDVVGDPFDVIASGPTCGDPTTFADARRELKHYGVWRAIPDNVRKLIENGAAGKIADTPEPSDPVFGHVHNFIVANNDAALKAAAAEARRRGFRPFILTRRMQGEAREVGKFLAGIADAIQTEGAPTRPPACILLGGETTVVVKGGGLGGRCQELALSFLDNINNEKHFCLLAAGSDGKDGPTPSAGALVDAKSLQITKKQGIDPGSFLSENNSHKFFGSCGELISTGPTGTNVMDLVVLLAG